MFEITGKKIPVVELLGVQPYILDAGTELSPEMKKILPKIVEEVIKVLKSWKTETTKKI